ncbi:MAG: hypothetical protein ACD_62C00532G0002 [uncultured bacterium]|nr:MAG: hypothetical protein ACD_62C00532G0002 [uncultured bacterium]
MVWTHSRRTDVLLFVTNHLSEPSMKMIFMCLLLITCFFCLPAGVVPQTQAGIPKTCEQIRTECDNIFKPRSAPCQKNEDCICFDAGLSNDRPCGGVTHAQQFEQTKTLRQEFREQKCGYTTDCVAWECRPTCTKGLCQTNGKYY